MAFRSIRGGPPERRGLRRPSGFDEVNFARARISRGLQGGPGGRARVVGDFMVMPSAPRRRPPDERFSRTSSRAVGQPFMRAASAEAQGRRGVPGRRTAASDRPRRGGGRREHSSDVHMGGGAVGGLEGEQAAGRSASFILPGGRMDKDPTLARPRPRFPKSSAP